jgi:hypothetical protein
MTLKEIIKELETVCLNHAQIESFYFGNDYNIDVSNRKYVLAYSEIGSATINNNSVILPIDLVILDRVDKGLNNELDVLSNTLSILLDIRALVSSNIYSDKFKIIQNSNMEPVTDYTDDETAGWKWSLELELFDYKDRCQVPIK